MHRHYSTFQVNNSTYQGLIVMWNETFMVNWLKKVLSSSGARTEANQQANCFIYLQERGNNFISAIDLSISSSE